MGSIFMVESARSAQKMLRSSLEAEGFTCSLCPDGQSAMETIASQQPDLVILDIDLPGLSGHDICRRLKADAETRSIPVVMLTGEARSVEERVRGLELGAEDYLFKPISPKVLAARIRSILRHTGYARS